MSKKIVAFSILALFAFICWCGSKNDNTDQSQKNVEINNGEIPVAEKTDWEPVVMQWDRGGEPVEVNENFEEPL